MNAPPIEDAAHIFLHVNLCAAVARAATIAPVALRVKIVDRVGDVEFTKTIAVRRADGPQAVVEFDVHQGIYRLAIDAPHGECSTSDYLDFLPDSSRTITETLAEGPPKPPVPVVLVDGRAPLSFLYVKPTFAFFNGPIACNRNVGSPLAVRSTVEYDQGSYHVWLYPGTLAVPPLSTIEHSDAANAVPQVAPTVAGSGAPTSATSPVVVTLQLRTPTGLEHDVRVPIAFPTPWSGWPEHVQFDVSEDMIDGLATENTGVLLCLKLWETRVH